MLEEWEKAVPTRVKVWENCDRAPRSAKYVPVSVYREKA